jgi:hypothetical protein
MTDQQAKLPSERLMGAELKSLQSAVILDEHHAAIEELRTQVRNVRTCSRCCQDIARIDAQFPSPAEPRTDDAVAMLREMWKCWEAGGGRYKLEPMVAAIIAAIEAEREKTKADDQAARDSYGRLRQSLWNEQHSHGVTKDALAAEKRAHGETKEQLRRERDAMTDAARGARELVAKLTEAEAERDAYKVPDNVSSMMVAISGHTLSVAEWAGLAAKLKEAEGDRDFFDSERISGVEREESLQARIDKAARLLKLASAEDDQITAWNMVENATRTLTTTDETPGRGNDASE